MPVVTLQVSYPLLWGATRLGRQMVTMCCLYWITVSKSFSVIQCGSVFCFFIYVSLWIYEISKTSTIHSTPFDYRLDVSENVHIAVFRWLFEYWHSTPCFISRSSRRGTARRGVERNQIKENGMGGARSPHVERRTPAVLVG